MPSSPVWHETLSPGTGFPSRDRTTPDTVAPAWSERTTSGTGRPGPTAKGSDATPTSGDFCARRLVWADGGRPVTVNDPSAALVAADCVRGQVPPHSYTSFASPS